jgi:hypothetical protein
MTDRDLLEVASRNYRDLTEAVAAMWEHVQPYLVPGTVGLRSQPDSAESGRRR